MNYDSRALDTGYVVLNVYIRLTPGDGNIYIYTTTRYMELRSTMDYAVHVTTRYMQLHSTGEESTWDYAAPGTIYNYAVQETTRYMGLRSTRDYAVHGTTQYMGLRSTWDYTVQETKRYR